MRFVRTGFSLLFLVTILACLFYGSPSARAYPLDGYEDTGIVRLEAYRIAQQNSDGEVLPFGAMLATRSIGLSLTDAPDFAIPPVNKEFSASLVEVLGVDAGGYGVAVLDLTDPTRPVYAAHQEERMMNPASVGKVLVAVGFFQALADAYPGDLGARQKILFDTTVAANSFIRRDHHEVPFWAFGDEVIERRPIVESDAANLWTWLDWMLSPSSNAAGSVVLQQAMLLQHFGKAYPVSLEQAESYYDDTSPARLRADLVGVLQDSLRRSGLNPGQLRQGSFFTREGRARVPGGKSWASSRAWMDLLVTMEKGQLVDPWSSAQIKKLLYLTEHRIRYASTPELDGAAVFYKSGSLYKCRPEKGFVCRNYAGNQWNFMNSIAIVESIRRSPKLRYAVVVNSNVLRKDAVGEHRALAARIHRLLEERHPPPQVPVVIVE
jgi:hypothetical protein